MKPAQILNKIFSCGIVMLASHALYAIDASEVTCPTAEQLKQFHFTNDYISQAINFDAESQRVQYFVEAEQDHRINHDLRSHWTFFSSTISAGQNEDMTTLLDKTIEQLVPVSPTAFQYNTEIEDQGHKYQDPICIYRLPNNNKFSAILSFIDFMGEDDDPNDDNDDDGADSDDSLHTKKHAIMARHQQHLAKLRKHLLGKK